MEITTKLNIGDDAYSTEVADNGNIEFLGNVTNIDIIVSLSGEQTMVEKSYKFDGREKTIFESKVLGSIEVLDYIEKVLKQKKKNVDDARIRIRIKNGIK